MTVADSSIDKDGAFPSLSGLRTAHARLLELRRLAGDTPELLAEVAIFVQRGSATGVLLDANTDRWSVQSLLDYWANILDRAGLESPDATLADFDPLLAPKLPDSDRPYVGLDTFHETDHQRFFGRRRLIAELIERLRSGHMLAVVGVSGSGKSSLVLAGLIPELRVGALPNSESWRYLPPIVPGSDPVGSLARLMDQLVPLTILQQYSTDVTHVAADPVSGITQSIPEMPQRISDLHQDPQCLAGWLRDTPTVLVIDQFEEVFTLCEDESARQAFVANVLELLEVPEPRHTVIITMRSDFETFVARISKLYMHFQAARAQVTPLSAAEVREAIEAPAAAVGLKFEAGVVELLLNDIVGEPAGLPLLQFTLLKLWENRERNRVTRAAYDQVGGGRLALARSADAFYGSLLHEEQRTARRILLRIGRAIGEGLEVTRSRVRRKALYQGGEDPSRVDRVLHKLVEARLVRLTEGETPEDDQVEVAHEALVRNWPTLAGWLEEEKAAISVRRRLESRAIEWVRLGGGAGLLDNVELREAQRWLASAEAAYLGYDPALPELVRASQVALEEAEHEQEAARERELAQARTLAEEQRQRAEESAQASRRLGRLAVILTVASIVAIGATVAAILSTQQALRQLNISQSQRLATLAQTQLDAAPEIGLLLAIEAFLHDNNPTTYQALSSALNRTTFRSTILEGHQDVVRSVAFSPDGRLVASASADKTARLWDVATGNKIRVFNAQAGLTSLAFSPDGQVIAAGSDDATVTLWAVSSGQPVGDALQGSGRNITSIAFSPDGKVLATASDDTTTVQLWDIGTRRPLGIPFKAHAKAVRSVAFSPDGRFLATASDDTTAALWDVARRNELVRRFDGHTAAVRSVAFSPDGRRITTASVDNTARVWDVATGKSLFILREPEGWVYTATFSPEGQRILTASQDKTARLWNAGGISLADFSGHQGAVLDAVFSPDGRMIATASADRTVRLWSAGISTTANFLIGNGAVNSAAFNRDGTRLVISYDDKTARLWNTDGRLITTFQGHTDRVNYATFSPDGTRIVTASDDKTARLWNTDGTLIATLQGHTDRVNYATFSPDGQNILTASVDHTARIWKLDGQQLSVLNGHTDSVNNAVFSPDGKNILTASSDASMWLWDIGGQQLAKFVGHTGGVNSAVFSPDGKNILSASADGTARLWNTDGQVLATLTGHTDQVISAVFSGDGQRILTASKDRTARLWDIHGQLLVIFTGHTDQVNSALFSPDGQHVLTTSKDGTARLSLFKAEDLLKVAICQVSRPLSDDEIQRFAVPTPLKFNFSQGQC